MKKYNYDVIVIGGGHAGTEAASAAARMGAKTILLTHDMKNIGSMSCNPSIGGIGKGHIVKEIDALDGVMGRAIDRSGIQFRVLNRSKGPAVQGPRAQADRELYKEAVQSILAEYKNLFIKSAIAKQLLFTNSDSEFIGVRTESEDIHAKSCIIATGTFLNSSIHIGSEVFDTKTFGHATSKSLAESIKKLGLRVDSLTTATPPRLNGDSISFNNLEEQKSDLYLEPFSFLTDKIEVPQISCFITRTNKKTHDIIYDNLDKSAVYCGQVDGKGPRYCMAIERKLSKFIDKDSHQIFLEPEGLNTNIIYPNGITTSLPRNIQEQFIRTIVGLENVSITKYGYLIQYEYVDPKQLNPALSLKKCPGIFLAGQINGTTGYEEAAGQGVIAGINAAIFALNSCKHYNENDYLILDRSDAYIGVMINDLITMGANEPYRMFTSRSEYRLLLRADNADIRLTDKGINIGCISKDRAESFINKKKDICAAKQLLNSNKLTPNKLAEYDINISKDGKNRSLLSILSFANTDKANLAKIDSKIADIDDRIFKYLSIENHYSGYMQQHLDNIHDYKKEASISISDINYKNISGLSAEIIDKLDSIRPSNIAIASRVPGITPSVITAIMMHAKKIV